MAASSLNTPGKLHLTGNTEQAWKSFKQRFDLYLLAAGFKKKPEEEKVALLLNLGGDELIEIYNSFDFPSPVGSATDPSKVLQTVVEKFDAHFAPRRTTLINRFKFHKCEQMSGEPVEAFITRLKVLMKDCDYKAQKNEQLRDQLAFGCRDDALREKFFREEDLTLEDAEKIAAAHQATLKQMAIFKDGDMQESVHKFVQKKATKKPNIIQSPAPESTTTSSKQLRPCKFCGTKHIWKKEECPAYGKKCSICNKENHSAIKCRKRKQKSPTKTAVRGVQEDADDDSDGEMQYVMRVADQSNESKVFVAMLVCGKDVEFQIDSGASVNVLPQHIIPNVPLQPYNIVLDMYNHAKLHTVGKCRIVITNPRTNTKHSVEFLVVKDDLVPILGKRASEQMKLMTIHYENISTINETFITYRDVFSSSLGNLPGVVKLTLCPNPNPVSVSSCRVPISMKDKVNKKLRELEKSQIIAKVDEPTDWVSRMVVGSKKSGDIRICIDPQALNKDLKREMHPLPVIDDVLPSLSKARVFSKFDLRNGYWHCVLDEPSSYLTTFQTPLGRYRWLRLPFGLAVSSEIFQKRLNTALEGLKGVVCVADDILVYGSGNTDEEANTDHDRNVCGLLERCRKQGIKLNACKTDSRKSEISFLGHKISKNGLKPDPDKVASIVNMKPPQNVVEIQRLAGMVNYLARFLPRLSDVMEPIRKLANKDVEWQWGKVQDNALTQVKKLVTSSPVLTYYDQTKPLVLQCDASQTGLGATLLQDGKPISYISRALTPTETRYAQIEKEMLAVVFGLTKFHQYTFGRLTKVVSDHKPLQSIMRKPLNLAPKRLQGMMLKVFQYDVELEYQPGKDMHIADLLSRQHLPENEGGQMFENINMISFLPIRPERLQKIKQATADDEVMNLLLETIIYGWPETKDEVPSQLLPYFNSRSEFSAQDGLIFKGERVVIPSALRDEIKKAIHSSHTGIEGCLRRARECVYWPSMNAEIKEYISQCETCLQFNNKQQKETLMSHELADRPWDRVGVDLFELGTQSFLVTVDYFSNFWEVDVLDSVTTNTVIRKLKAHFARYGIPSILVSDNGPQFVSETFRDFALKYDFQHRTSSPKYPQSNGMAESAVKTAKNLIKKALTSGSDPYLAILDHRNTPSQDMELSPAQRNLGRRTRTLLPMTATLLTPKGIDVSLEKKKKRLKNIKSAWYYDKVAKDLQPLSEGDVVRIQPTTLGDKVWKRGVVHNRLDERSYEVETDSGVIRRNRQQLRKTNERDQVDENVNTDSVSPHSDDVPLQHHSGMQDDEQDSAGGARATRGLLPNKFKDYIVSK